MAHHNDERRFRHDRMTLTYREVQQCLSHGVKVCGEDFERHLFLDDPDEHWQLERHHSESGGRGCQSAWRHFFARHPELRTRAVLAQAYDAQHGGIR